MQTETYVGKVLTEVHTLLKSHKINYSQDNELIYPRKYLFIH